MAAGLLWASAAGAQNYTATIQTGMNLGNVAAGKVGDSTFRIDPSTGSVLRLSGAAARTAASTVRAVVVITCNDAGTPGSCDAANVAVQAGSTGAPTGRARTLTGFRIAMSTATLVGATSGTAPINFTIGPVGTGGGKTFFLGADFAIAGDNSGLPSGVSQSSFYVFVAKAPSTPTTGAIGMATATVFRALTISKIADLSFGTIVKPSAGAGTVNFDAASGQRTVTGGGGSLDSPAPVLAQISLAGEGGQVFSIGMPSTFQLTGATPLTVTTNSTVSGLQTFTGSLGSQAAVTFRIGGSFPYSSTTGEGAYTGAFTVTADYN